MNLLNYNLSSEQDRKLLKLFSRLGKEQRSTLLAFAEFLTQHGVQQQEPVSTPQTIPRPPKEGVVAAIKRLAATYPMLDKSEMLNETSGLMAEHVMQGRPASEVIDELEKLFAAHYQKLLSTVDNL